MLNLRPSVSAFPVDRPRYSVRPAKQQRTSSRRIIATALLLLSVLGYLYNNFAIWRFSIFTLDLSHLLLVLAVAASLFLATRPDPQIVIIWIGFMAMELMHALLFDLASDVEWIKSVAQVGAYSLAFVIISGFKLRYQDLVGLRRVAVTLTLFLGGFAILQFSLLNTIGVDLSIPEAWRSTTYAIAFEDYRYVGVARAQGLSREPAELAFGLAILLSFVIFLRQNQLIEGRVALIAVLVALVGIIVTLSPTGVLTVAAIILGTWFVSRSTRSSQRLYSLVVILLVFFVVLVTPLGQRLNSIMQGSDVSSLVRTAAPIRLLLNMSDSAEFLVFGTGLGLESRNIQTYLEIYQPLVPWELRGEIRIHNIFAVIRFQQGLLGLFAYLALLWMVLRPTDKTALLPLRNLTPVIVLLVMFVFSSGYYASPMHWSLLAFVAVLRRLEWASREFDAMHTSIVHSEFGG